MKLVIDEKACIKKQVTLPEVLYALAVRSGLTGQVVRNMLKERIIVRQKDSNEHAVTPRWDNILDTILKDSTKTCKKTTEELLDLAKKIQELFPKQKMVSRLGEETPYYFRCNRTEIRKHLAMFFENYGDVSDEDILDATKRYVSMHALKNYRGMRLAKYFIWKNDRKYTDEDTIHIEQLSDLATFLENKEEGKEIANTIPESWTIRVS